jgi:hypothetical protein
VILQDPRDDQVDAIDRYVAPGYALQMLRSRVTGLYGADVTIVGTDRVVYRLACTESTLHDAVQIAEDRAARSRSRGYR